MAEPRNEGEPTESSRGVGRIDWNWIIGLFGVGLGIVAIFFQPDLPYQLTPATALVLLGGLSAIVWLVFKVRQWARDRRRTRGVGVAAFTAAALMLVFAVGAFQPEETGHRSVLCEFGVFGWGKGMVHVLVEPEEDVEHEVTVRWAGWLGRPKPVELDQPHYFTFEKRDWRSPTVEVTIEPAADITCGDGRPPTDHPSTHIRGDEWTRVPEPTQETPSPAAD